MIFSWTCDVFMAFPKLHGPMQAYAPRSMVRDPIDSSAVYFIADVTRARVSACGQAKPHIAGSVYQRATSQAKLKQTASCVCQHQGAIQQPELFKLVPHRPPGVEVGVGRCVSCNCFGRSSFGGVAPGPARGGGKLGKGCRV